MVLYLSLLLLLQELLKSMKPLLLHFLKSLFSLYFSVLSLTPSYSGLLSESDEMIMTEWAWLQQRPFSRNQEEVWSLHVLRGTICFLMT